MSRYVDGIGIRITMDAISHYGDGHATLQAYANCANVPIINMGDDCYHPCQGLADIMGWSERYSSNLALSLDTLNGKTLLLTWGNNGFARPWVSIQSHLLLASRFGMHIKLAYPEGYDIDPKIIEKTKENCHQHDRQFQIIHDPNSGYSEEVDVVYVRNWVTKNAYAEGIFNYEEEINASLNLNEWIVTAERMKKTNNALFANPMPLDRGKEAEDSVADSNYSVIYDVAENRMHVQKALLALTMGWEDQATRLYQAI